jgi:serine/threonine protein kinase
LLRAARPSDMSGDGQEFSYKKVTLYKEQTLGTGSYGIVCKAKCDQLVCAAKIMHNALFQFCDPSSNNLLLTKFRQECNLNSAAKHPNIVQYIHTYLDPETRFPVLLMELCDESLSKFLDRSKDHPPPYHVELDLSNDIAQALSYLHTNGVIHRDLTSNNVLLIAGCRAKVTDFGMSKLVSVNPRFTPLSMCPGNALYMSPEALRQPPQYSTKLDIFSWGVLAIQILTRLFPNPGPQFNTVEERDGRIIHEVIPEHKRRKSQIDLVDPNHPLLELAIKCLHFNERSRPTANDLCVQMDDLIQSSAYTKSKQKPITPPQKKLVRRNTTAELELENEVEKLQLELQQMSRELSAKDKEVRSVNGRMARLQDDLEASKKHAEAALQTVTQRDETITILQQNIEQQQHIISTLRAKLDDDTFVPSPSPEHVPNLPNIPQVPPRSKESLIFNYHKEEEEVVVKERGEDSGHTQPPQPKTRDVAPKTRDAPPRARDAAPKTREAPPRTRDAAPKTREAPPRTRDAAPKTREAPPRTRDVPPRQPPHRAQTIMAMAVQDAKDLVKEKVMRFTVRKGEKSPEKMARGSAISHANTAYFACFSSNKIHFYQCLIGREKWGTLPKTHYVNFSLVVINGFVTTIGGSKAVGNDQPTNTLLTLAAEGSKKKWVEILSAMPTPRQEMAVVSNEHFIVVMGGRGNGGERLNTVEVYRHENKQWSIAGCLPLPLTRPTATIVGEEIFVGSGSPSHGTVSKDVFSSTMSKLLSPYYAFPASQSRNTTGQQHSAWRKVAGVNADHYSLCSLNNRLLAVGGLEMSHCNSSAIRKYDPDKNNWEVVGHINHGRCLALATHLMLDTLVIVGGLGSVGRDQGTSNLVEIAKVSYA